MCLGIRHPIFTAPLIYLPMLLIALDRLITDRKVLMYSLFVRISMFTNYYFLYINTVAMGVYALISFAQTSTNPTLAGENTLSAASHQVRLPSEYLLSSSVKLFHQMRQVFHDTAAPPSNPMGICVDSKRRKNLMQKRVAIGHKQDAHGQSQSSFG